MDTKLKELMTNLESSDDRVRMDALKTVLKLANQKVDWIYEVWDDLFEMLEHENSFRRSTAIKVICSLAKSDDEDRLSRSLDLLLAHTKDEKFITSRQCLQETWKVALTGGQKRKRILAHLEKRFRECTNEKHYNLLRTDILTSIKSMFDEDKDEKLLVMARALIAEEKEDKYRRKYEAILSQ